ncbi:hypothetical protein [Nocardia gipuzkoensis]
MAWEWLGLRALNVARRRTRTGLWDYLSDRTRSQGAVALERERNRGAVDKMGALPPETTLFEAGPDGWIRLERDPGRMISAVTVEMAPADTDTDVAPIDVTGDAKRSAPPRELPVPTAQTTSALLSSERP